VQIRNSSATACAKSGRFKWYRFGIPLFACLPKIVQSQTEIGIRHLKQPFARKPKTALSPVTDRIGLKDACKTE
jgi:hypothetical protein